MQRLGMHGAGRRRPLRAALRISKQPSDPQVPTDKPFGALKLPPSSMLVPTVVSSARLSPELWSRNTATSMISSASFG